MSKDWTGNSLALFSTNGDTSHGNEEREAHDYYATPPEAVRMLLGLEMFEDDVLEPCAGGGHVAEVLKDHGYNVTCNDLYDHGYRLDNRVDFLHGIGSWHGSIVSNPPYKYAAEFVEHALDIVPDGRKVAMFLKLSFLEGKGRAALFKKYPPRTVYVSRSRLNCGKNGEFRGTSAVCYCWFVWVKGWSGRPEIVWFN